MEADDAHKIEIWKTIIDVQKHFNELEMRIRNVAVTVLAAFLAAAGITMKDNMHVALGRFDLSLTSLVLLGGALCWLAFYGMDRFWYHRLLMGAVKQGLVVEESLAARFPESGLTKAIGDESPVKLGSLTIRSGNKIDIFYWSVALPLILAAAIAWTQPSKPVPPATPKTSGTPLIAS